MVRGLRFLVPVDNENRWTDLLAVLISTDPSAVAELLSLGDVHGRDVSVAREVRGERRQRVDLQVLVDGRLHAIFEVKVLSGLGPHQLARYAQAYLDADSYLLVYPARLVIDPGAGSRWRGVTWEALLDAFIHSANPWVAETSAAWLAHLSTALPHVDASTHWNDLRPGDAIPLIMRTRMSWVYSHPTPPAPLVADYMCSGGSKAWVARLQMPADQRGYVIAAEVEDTSARSWLGRLGRGQPNPVAGPKIWVGLRQHNVTSSEGFDWDYLASLWAHRAGGAHRLDHHRAGAARRPRPGRLATHRRSRRPRLWLRTPGGHHTGRMHVGWTIPTPRRHTAR